MIPPVIARGPPAALTPGSLRAVLGGVLRGTDRHEKSPRPSIRVPARYGVAVCPGVVAMSTCEWRPAESSPAVDAAYEAVQAILSDDHNFERGVEEARRVAEAVHAERGSAAVVDLVVELSLTLGEALEEIAVERGIAAADLAEVWWVG